MIEGIVSGVMGLRPSEAHEPFDITTLSQLPGSESEATVSGVAIKNNIVTVAHTGASSTRLTNTIGPALRWRAVFPGFAPQLSVNGRIMKAQHSHASATTAISWVDVQVAPGASVTVRNQ